MFLFYLFIFVALLLVLVKFSNYFKICYYLLKLPGPQPLPIIGNVLLFKGSYKDYGKIFINLFDKYGQIFALWLGPIPFTFISNAALAKTLLTNTTAIDKSWILRYVTQDYGDSIAVCSASKWKTNMKIIRSGFNIKMLNSFMPSFNEKSKILVEQMAKELNNTKSFNIFKYFSRATFDATCANIMGVNISSQLNKNSPYFDAFRSDCRILTERFLKIWLFPNCIFKRSLLGKKHKENIEVIMNTVENVINERKEQIADTKLNCNDTKTLLDFMLATKETETQLTDEQIRDEVNFLIIAGFVTTAVSLSYTLLILAHLQDIQDKVYDEISSVFEDSERPIESDDLSKLTYLEAVIKESLRLFPSVAELHREAIDDLELEDYKFPKGSQIIFSIYHIHRDPNVWKDPEVFNPERFLVDKSPAGYYPFGAGRRICAGMNFAYMFMKTIIVSVLRKYKFHTDLDIKNLNLTVDVSLGLVGGHLVRITERNSSKKLI